MSKPKRVGSITSRYSSQFNLKPEVHPVYEYRGYFIARGYSIANTPASTYYSVYSKFENGEVSQYAFDINPQDGVARLKYAADQIDSYLDTMEKYK